MKIVEPMVKPISEIDGIKFLKTIELIGRTCYRSEDKIDMSGESAKRLVKGFIESGHHSLLEHVSVTMQYRSNIACYKDLTRHRFASPCVESTRFCSYDKGKFGNEIAFLKPIEIPEGTKEFEIWKQTMQQIEEAYMKLAKLGAKPDQLSLLLPQSTAATFNITANLREWRHILNLRAVGTTGTPRPCVKEIMQPTLELFQRKIPVIFDDIRQKTR